MNAATAAIVALAPILVGLLAVSAMFSAAETALTAASRSRMHQLEREGDRSARRVNRLIGDQETMIGAVLLGNNLINILASALTTQVITAAIPGGWGIAIATAVMTVLVLVFAEVLPKTLAITKSDDVARFLSAPTLLVVRVFGPVIYTIQWIVRRTLGLFGVKLGYGDGRASGPTRRSGGRWSITTRRVWGRAATGGCWAVCWTCRRWTSRR